MQGARDPKRPGGPSAATDGALPLLLLVTPGIAAAASFAMLPVTLGALARGWNLSDARLGVVASVELAGLTLGTVAAVLLMRRCGRRRTALGAMALLGLANLLTMAAPSVGLLIGLRAVAGLAAGAGLAVCYANLSGAARAERNFAIFTLAQLLLGAGGMLSLPRLVGVFGWAAPYGLLTVVAAIGAAAAFVQRAPEVEVGAMAAAATARARPSPRAWAGLGGVCLYFAGVAAVWTYAERIGATIGIDPAQVATILAGSQVVAMIGAICAGILAGRAPVAVGLAAGTLMTAAGIAALVVVKGPVGFALAVSAVNFAWNYVTAPQFAVLASIDSDGSVAGLMSTVTGIGVAGGPALGAALVGRGFASLLALGVLLSLASLGFMWPALGARPGGSAAPARLAREGEVGA